MTFLLGLGGGTNSGKTTICKKLVESLPNLKIKVFNQDKYFKTLAEAQLSFPNEAVNWETVPALKMDNLVEDVIRERDSKTCDVIVVEGHLVLTYEPLYSLFDSTAFIVLSRELAVTRRVTRTYDPPDYPGYFDTFVWPGYLKIVEDLKATSFLNPEWLDAEFPEDCYERVAAILKRKLS